MTATTINFALPYPTALDRPCDFASQWCDFTDALQTVIDGFQTVIDRTNPVIPIARMMVTTPVDVASNGEIPFDTLSVDTADLVDFDFDPAGVTIRRAGRFVLVGSATVLSTGINNNYVRLFISGDQDIVLDRTGIPGLTLGLNTANLTINTGSTRRALLVTRDDSTTLAITVQAATFSVFWHADRASP